MKPGVDNTGLQVYWLLWGCIYPTLLFGFGDIHSYCGCGGWHTNTSYASDISAVKNDVVIVREDYKTGTYKVEKPEVVSGVLSAIDFDKKTLTIGGVEYGIACDGEGPYGMAVNKTRYEEYNWASLIGTEITVRTDGKYVVATLK